MKGNKIRQIIKIYSDGSCSNGVSGVSSVAVRDSVIIGNMADYLNCTGDKTEVSEYNGILLSLKLALKVVKRGKIKSSIINILCDNSAALSFMGENSEVHFNMINELAERDCIVTFGYCNGENPFHLLCHHQANVYRMKLLETVDAKVAAERKEKFDSKYGKFKNLLLRNN